MPVSKVKSEKGKVKREMAVKTAGSNVKKTVKAVSSDVKKTVTVKSVEKNSGLTLPVYGLTGDKKGTVSLSKEIFGAKVNDVLMAQAVRVYLVNQRQGTASTKTRGEVIGSTRKIYRQKGTGRARHGAIKAPIFVGGGIALGPHPRNFELKLSKQMKKKALFSALSAKATGQKIFVVDVAAASGKTKEVYQMLKSLELLQKNNSKVLLVLDMKSASAQAARNLDGVSVEPAQNLNTYQVMNSNYLVFAKDAIEQVEKVFGTTK